MYFVLSSILKLIKHLAGAKIKMFPSNNAAARVRSVNIYQADNHLATVLQIASDGPRYIEIAKLSKM